MDTDKPRPPDTRPHREPSASGPERTVVDGATRLTYRQVGWLGHRDGAFYSLDEDPSQHEPGGWSPLHVLAHADDVPQPDVDYTRPLTFHREHDGTLSLESAVYQAVGAASMCWQHVDHAGVFDDARARWVADGLLAYLRELAAGPVADLVAAYEPTPDRARTP